MPLRPGVTNVDPITAAHHALMGLIDVPVVFGEHVVAHCRRWIVEQPGETDALNSLVLAQAGQFQNGWPKIDGTDQRTATRRRDTAGTPDDQRRLDPVVVKPRFAAREGTPVVAAIDEIRVLGYALPLQFLDDLPGEVVGSADLVIVLL